MKNHEIWDVIVKALEQKASVEELERLEDWLGQDEENRRTFDGVQKIWRLGPVMGAKVPMPDVDKAWQSLDNKVENDDSHDSERMGRHTIGRFGLKPRSWLKVAASLAILVVVITYVVDWTRGNDGNSDVTLGEAHTEYGNVPEERIYLAAAQEDIIMHYLPDSSKVWLNLGAKLSYPRDFGQGNRTAYLDGEAFFDIRRDTSSTFTIHANGTETRVLGTSFNLKSPVDGPTELVVVSGKVSFKPEKGTHKGVFLLKGEKASYDKGTDKLTKGLNKNPDFLVWKEGNPSYTYEKENPSLFLSADSRWGKNFIHQSILQGEIINQASLVSYKDVKLQYTVINDKGQQRGPYHFTVFKTVGPKSKVKFKYGLLDVFTKTDKIKVEVVGAKLSEH